MEDGQLLESVHLGLINSNGNCERLKVLNNETYNCYTAEYINRRDYYETGVYFTEAQWEQWNDSEEPSNIQGFPSISEDEAKKIVDKLLNKIGIDYLNLSKIDKVIGITGVYDSCGTELGERVKAYRLQYIRQVNSVPVTYTSAEEAYNEYSQSWNYERVTFVVDDRGIIEMDWYAPYKLVETITDSANM